MRISYQACFTLGESAENPYAINHRCFASRPIVSVLFDELSKDIGSEHYRPTLLVGLYTCKLRWLSKNKVISRVFKLSDQHRWFFLNRQ